MQNEKLLRRIKIIDIAAVVVQQYNSSTVVVQQESRPNASRHRYTSININNL
jgi:hypothetical protein